jgi:KDO2-lipid IV(A) lauroyltransferase
LKAGRIVAIVADRDFQNKGVRMPFLGGQASIPLGPAVLSLKSGAPVVPAFFMRESGAMNFHMIIHPPIYPSAKNQKSDTLVKARAVAKEYINVIESMIQRFPEQWLMFRDYERG